MSNLENEKTHTITMQLSNAAHGATAVGSAGLVTFLVTVTATLGDTIADLVLSPSKVKVDPGRSKLNIANQKYVSLHLAIINWKFE